MCCDCASLSHLTRGPFLPAHEGPALTLRVLGPPISPLQWQARLRRLDRQVRRCGNQGSNTDIMEHDASYANWVELDGQQVHQTCNAYTADANAAARQGHRARGSECKACPMPYCTCRSRAPCSCANRSAGRGGECRGVCRSSVWSPYLQVQTRTRTCTDRGQTKDADNKHACTDRRLVLYILTCTV